MNQQERINDLLKRGKQVECFNYENVIYLGNYGIAVSEFVNAMPYPADFHVWLQDNYKQLYQY